MQSLRSVMAASAMAGASMVSGCAAIDLHVVLGTLEIGGHEHKPKVPHYSTSEACLKDGQNMFDRFGRQAYAAAQAKSATPVSIAWRCNDWVVTSRNGFELRGVARVTPVIAP